MTLLLALAMSQTDFHASHYFPLVPGSRWTYEDSATPGTVIEWKVGKEIIPPKPDDQVPGSETAPSYFPIYTTIDGINKGETDYFEKDDTCSHVGNGPNHPITPQPILVVSRAGAKWDFYINASAYSSEAVHFIAHSNLGPNEMVEGKTRETVIVEMRIMFGSGKRTIDVKQTWKYAADVGLYEFSEVGHNVDAKIDHTQKLVKFEPGGSI